MSLPGIGTSLTCSSGCLSFHGFRTLSFTTLTPTCPPTGQYCHATVTGALPDGAAAAAGVLAAAVVGAAAAPALVGAAAAPPLVAAAVVGAGAGADAWVGAAGVPPEQAARAIAPRVATAPDPIRRRRDSFWLVNMRMPSLIP